MSLLDEMLTSFPDVEQLEVLATDLNGRFFGKRFPISRLEGFLENGLAMPRAMYVLDCQSDTFGDHVAMGGADGDPDIAVDIVPESLGIVTWGNRPRAQVLLASRPGSPDAHVDPRAVLAHVLSLYQARGLTPVAAFELEFTLFDASSQEGVQIAVNPKTGQRDIACMLSTQRLSDFEDVLDDIVTCCKSQHIGTEAVCAEYGAGQFEINFPHYTDALQAADHAQLFRRTVREIACQHGMRASFMAKPDLETVGNGQHIHISVLDQDGRNIFDGGDEPAALLRHAVGGLMALLPEAMLFWAPNINSYRRFGKIACVPQEASWAVENRMVAFRIPLAKGKAWRLENRVAGADANSYLALAATLAAMLHGMDEACDPGPERSATAGIGISNPKAALIPATLPDALARLRASSVMPGLLGADFVRLYGNHRQGEYEHFLHHISQRELDWYL